MGFCLLLLWGYGDQWEVESFISDTFNPLLLVAQLSLPQKASLSAAQPIPALGCGQLPALTHPQLALKGSWNMVPCPLFLSHCVPRESGHSELPALCTGSTVLISKGLPAIHLGGKETQACLSPHETCLHFFPLFFFHSPVFSLPEKKKIK